MGGGGRVDDGGVAGPATTRRDAERGVPLDGCLAIVVLGAAGDLARKKTYPSLYALHRSGYLPPNTHVLGYARLELSERQLKEQLRAYLKDGTEQQLDAFLAACSYLPGEGSLTTPDAEAHEVFTGLTRMMDAWEAGVPGDCCRLFYLALPPVVYPEVCAHIKAMCMSARGWTRIVLEKPFGRDLATSEALSEAIAPLFTEDQLYRIDHYLGKELVQNLVVMRFANRFLAPLWNRDNISNVQIIFKEPFGTEGRGGYFDKYGIIRDVIQNHLLQVLALVAMEKPCSLSPDDIRDEKLKVLRCIPPLSTQNVVLGQYTRGESGEPGYTDDPTVPVGSQCPTFALCIMYVQNERWDGVPFIIKAGKALNEGKAEIRIQLRDVPGDLFGAKREGKRLRNELVVRLQPDPSIYMKMAVKEPGLGSTLTQAELELSYNRRYDIAIPDAYERLILDCVRGDQQHFVRRDELQASWGIFTPLLHYIDAGGCTPRPYAYGSRGPPAADALREAAGHVTNITRRDVTWKERGNRGGGGPFSTAPLSP